MYRHLNNPKPRGVYWGIGFLLWTRACFAADTVRPSSPINIFAPASTPAGEIYHLALFVFAITGAMFVVVAGLLCFAVFRFRARKAYEVSEPPQIYGSNQIELAWTVIPVLTVVVLFLATARVIFAIQDAPKPPAALDVTVIGHQFWWEYRYPSLGIVTANELHVPLSHPNHPTSTYLRLTSADQITIMAAVQRPIAVNCIQEKAPSPAWKRTPSWFLLAEEDRMIVPESQRFMAERMGAIIRSHAVDHTPMHTAPNLVVDVILEAARDAIREGAEES